MPFKQLYIFITFCLCKKNLLIRCNAINTNHFEGANNEHIHLGQQMYTHTLYMHVYMPTQLLNNKFISKENSTAYVAYIVCKNVTIKVQTMSNICIV